MLIVAMSFSGSIVFLTILICIFIGKKFLSSTWIYSMLKINLIFYCVPLSLFKYLYSDILLKIFGVQFIGNTLYEPIRNVIEISNTGSIYVDFKLYIYVIWIIWLIGLLFAFKKHLNQYHHYKSIQKNIIENSNYIEIFESVKREMGVKKKVSLINTNEEMTICTMGIIKKFIIIPTKGITSKNLYYIFKHELIHIKRKDIIYRYIMIFALLINWFNPIIYLYFYITSIYCEQSCDTILIRNIDKAERKRYSQLIIDMALSKTKYQDQTFFSKSKKVIEGRLKNMLKIEKTKKSIRICSFFLGVIILFSGSLTVFAYEEPTVISGQTEFPREGFHSTNVEREFIQATEVRFSNEGAMVTKEFIRQDGSSYDLTELENMNHERITCSHSFVSGYYKEHQRYSDSSCKTDCYTANQCQKCGYVGNKIYSHTETSTKCTH